MKPTNDKTMKPQFKPEEIYLDLSKLSGEERLLTPKIIDSQDIFLKDFINDGNFTDYYDLHFGKYGWTISKNLEDSEKQEITFSEFRQLFSKGEEVLQVENYTREDIEKAYRAGEKGATYYFKDTTVILPTTYEGVDG